MANADSPKGTPEEVLGIRMRREREARGWTQKEVAARLNARGFDMHFSTIAKMEAGSRSIRLDEAVAIAELFNVPLDDLMKGPYVEWLKIADDLAKAVDMHRDALQLEKEARDRYLELLGDFGQDVTGAIHPAMAGRITHALDELKKLRP